jgi:K+-sensing histidine kinase KdpD
VVHRYHYGFLVPLEIFEIHRQPTIIKVIVLLLNIAIVAYLVLRIRKRSDFHCSRSAGSTGKWDNKRQGKNGERTHADAVLWLCSDKASYITGQSISVDGGYVMR